MLTTKGSTRKIEVVTVCAYIVFSGLYLVSSKKCSNQANSLPVLRFCTNDKRHSINTVVLDGNYPKTLDGGQNCTCTARALYDKTSNFEFENLLSSPYHQNGSCGINVIFEQTNNGAKLVMCKDDGSLPIDENIKNITVMITLLKITYPTDTNYRVCVQFDQGNLMDITCEKTDTDNTKSNNPHQTTPEYTEVTKTHLIEGTQLATNTGITDVTTTTQRNISEIDRSNALTEETNQQDNSFTMYLAIGCGTGGILIALFVGIFLLQNYRQRKRQSENNNEHSDDNDEDGVQYNSLYISADDDTLPQIANNQEASGIAMEKVAYQVEGEYTEINSIELQKKNKSTETTADSSNNNINTKGNYSEIDLDENVLSTALSSYNENSKENVMSKTQNNVVEVESSFVKHVLAPGDCGGEYAVVEKQSENNIKNDVYAVVDRNRKRNS